MKVLSEDLVFVDFKSDNRNNPSDKGSSLNQSCTMTHYISPYIINRCNDKDFNFIIETPRGDMGKTGILNC